MELLRALSASDNYDPRALLLQLLKYEKFVGLYLRGIRFIIAPHAKIKNICKKPYSFRDVKRRYNGADTLCLIHS